MRHFDELLQDLFKRVVMMGSLVESMIQLAVRTYTERNESVSAEVYAKEEEVNRIQVEVDEKCVQLTATQAPVATDVRFIFMVSRIAGELERVADQTINICQNTHYLLSGPQIPPLVDLPIMAQVAHGMIGKSLTAMTNRDCVLADEVFEDEQKVDAFRDQIFRILLTHMMADPRTIQQSLSLVLIARNLERIGDHATNIAEEVIYWIQGRDIRHGKVVGRKGLSGGAPSAPLRSSPDP